MSAGSSFSTADCQGCPRYEWEIVEELERRQKLKDDQKLKQVRVV